MVMKIENVQEQTTRAMSRTVRPTVALAGMITQVERILIKMMDIFQPQHYTISREEATYF